jgi:hypothetical protein
MYPQYNNNIIKNNTIKENFIASNYLNKKELRASCAF